MNTAEQSRTSTLACQIRLVEAKINKAIAKGRFDCEGDGHLEPSTLEYVRDRGYRIRNDKVAFNNFWYVSWKQQ